MVGGNEEGEIRKYNINRADWDKLRGELMMPSLVSEGEVVNSKAKELTRALQEEMRSSIPLMKGETKGPWGIPFRIISEKFRPPDMMSTLKRADVSITTRGEETAEFLMETLLPDNEEEGGTEEQEELRRKIKFLDAIASEVSEKARNDYVTTLNEARDRRLRLDRQELQSRTDDSDNGDDDDTLIAHFLGADEFLPRNTLLNFLSKFGCELTTTERQICENFIFLLCGFDAAEFNISMLPVILGHTPAGTSTRTLVHYAQLIRSGE
uniref:Uncharacterized protein n=1 Tax=Timema poppense TaxID=170557 RepID=A0A7R9H3U4_TIMPO|nr:unnamed protein product [Timema poppensis]